MKNIIKTMMYTLVVLFGIAHVHTTYGFLDDFREAMYDVSDFIEGKPKTQPQNQAKKKNYKRNHNPLFHGQGI